MKNIYTPIQNRPAFLPFAVIPGTTPFSDAESAWFWCLQTAEAIHGGARLRPGMGSTPRPCESVDIQNVVLRLARQQLLSETHLNILAKYGSQQMRPPFASRDSELWQQALTRMTPVLQHKGIVA